MDKTIPTPVVRRLTKYLTYSRSVRDEGRRWLASRELAWALGLTSSTVRQDLTHIRVRGVAKLGYPIDAFDAALSKILGGRTRWNVAIIGAGNVGCALAVHSDLQNENFRVAALFDKAAGVVGRRVGSLRVLPMGDLPRAARLKRIDIAILAVPPSAAQAAADHVVLCGIPAILNLASANIKVPKKTALVNSRILECLMELSHRLQRNVRHPRRAATG